MKYRPRGPERISATASRDNEPPVNPVMARGGGLHYLASELSRGAYEAVCGNSGTPPWRRLVCAGRHCGFNDCIRVALNKLDLADRQDPFVVVLAKFVIELAKEGERDPDKLCEGALKILRK